MRNIKNLREEENNMNTIAVTKVGNKTYKVIGGISSGNKPFFAVSTYKNDQYVGIKNYYNIEDVRRLGIEI